MKNNVKIGNLLKLKSSSRFYDFYVNLQEKIVHLYHMSGSEEGEVQDAGLWEPAPKVRCDCGKRRSRLPGCLGRGLTLCLALNASSVDQLGLGRFFFFFPVTRMFSV